MKLKNLLGFGILLFIIIFLVTDYSKNEEINAYAMEQIPTVIDIQKDPSCTEPKGEIVYITDTGKCYHTEDCACLNKSKIEIGLEEAQELYRPCKLCHPEEIKKSGKVIDIAA